jgi:hypothetical protein
MASVKTLVEAWMEGNTARLPQYLLPNTLLRYTLTARTTLGAFHSISLARWLDSGMGCVDA